jgi:hypothetical protein
MLSRTINVTAIELQVSQLVSNFVSVFSFVIMLIFMSTELLEAVKASLRAKTAALADDNWMYEAEKDVVPR